MVYPTVASFDVGIKNLAYCIMTFCPSQPPSKQFPIRDWGVIDLTQFVSFNPNLLEEIPISIADYLSYSSSLKIGELRSLASNLSLSPLGTKATIIAGIRQKLISRGIPVPKSRKANTIPLIDLGKIMMEQLDSKPDLLLVDHVIIENQPVLKNPTMKSIQMMLYTYFLIRGMIDVEPDTSQKKIQMIQLVSPTKKLEVYEKDLHGDLSIREQLEAKYSKYTLTKKLGIEYCQQMIKEADPHWISFFQSHQKKDDLADAFLQGAYFLKRRWKVPKKRPSPSLPTT